MIEWLVNRLGIGKIALLFTLLLAVCWFMVGWTVNGWRLEIQLADWEKEAAQTISAALESAREVEAAGETLAQRQLALEAENLNLKKERDDALRKTTTGRACLNAPTVRLLNDRHPGAGIRTGLPASPCCAAGTFAAAALDSDPSHDGYEASDTDVALWANYAIDRYDACRGRIDALRQFYEGKNQ